MEYVFAPNFLIFQMFIKWFIINFGFGLYLLIVVGSVFTLCCYFIWKCYKRGYREAAAGIIIFTFMAIGTLVGLGNDINCSLMTYLNIK